MPHKNKSLLFIFILVIAMGLFISQNQSLLSADQLKLDEQEITVRTIKQAMPAVVSIIVTDNQKLSSINLKTGETSSAQSKIQLGSGTGFLVSKDGYILTNKHVIDFGAKRDLEFRVIMSSGKRYYAQLIGKDPINDLAILKIYDKNLPYLELGDSNKTPIGTTVLAIGNALGRYQNSVTKGIISGIGRDLVASDGEGNSSSLNNVLQTDAEINKGNSGGPLVNLQGRVVGINVAIDEEGRSIGFAIPVNDAKPVVRSILQNGRIIRARLGVRFVTITPELAYDNNLKSQTGAWVVMGDLGEPAVVPNSPADKAGIQKDDIITEINGIKIEGLNTLLSVAQNYQPGDKIGLKVIRGGKMMTLNATLDEFK